MRVYHKVLLVGLLAGFLPLAAISLVVKNFEAEDLRHKAAQEFKTFLQAPKHIDGPTIGYIALTFDPVGGDIQPTVEPIGLKNVYRSYLLDRSDLSASRPKFINLQSEQFSYLGFCQNLGKEGRCLLIARDNLKDAVSFLMNKLILLSLAAGILVFAIVVWLGRQIVGPLEELTHSLIRSTETPIPGNLKLKSESNDEVGILVNKIRAYLLKLQEYRTKEAILAKNNALAEWAVQVAHDLRSPLSALSVLVSEEGASASTNGHSLARDAIQRMKEIADSLLNRSRDLNIVQHEAEIETLSCPDTNLSPLLQKLMNEKRLSIQSTGKRIVLRSEGIHQSTMARVDPVEFCRVVSNIVNNALESIADAGAIHVEVQHSKSEISIQITDSGCGIPNDVLPKLTIKGSSYNKTGGTGLGLYHARSMVETAWKGRLEFHSKVDKGTTVVIRLPAIPRQDRNEIVGGTAPKLVL